MRPIVFCQITKSLQNPDQYGFTSGFSYLNAALQRHDVQQFCIDQKKMWFSVSLDGMIAFDVVSGPIQARELFCTANESGQ